jgi:hypothetical protein
MASSSPSRKGSRNPPRDPALKDRRAAPDAVPADDADASEFGPTEFEATEADWGGATMPVDLVPSPERDD